MLKIFNTLKREKQSFVPIITGQVRMYVCGMTVYDYCHLGHARVMVVFDDDGSDVVWEDFDLCQINKITLKYNRKSGTVSADTE